MPRAEDGLEPIERADALVEGLPGENGELDFGDVQPAAVLGGVVDLKLLGEPARFVRFEGFVERRRRVGTQIIHDEDDSFGGGIDLIGELTKEVSEVDEGALVGGFSHDAPGEGLDREKDVGRTAPAVLVVYASSNTGFGRDRNTNVVEQLLTGFIDAHLRETCIVGTVVDLEHVLHGVHERSAVLGWNAEPLYLPRFDVVFFSRRQTVVTLRVSTTLSSTNLSASSASVHRARPAGGSLQANVMS